MLEEIVYKDETVRKYDCPYASRFGVRVGTYDSCLILALNQATSCESMVGYLVYLAKTYES